MLDALQQPPHSGAFLLFEPVMGRASGPSSQAATLLRLRAGSNTGAHMLHVAPSSGVSDMLDVLAFLIDANVGPRPQPKSNTDIHTQIVGLGARWQQAATLSSRFFQYISSEDFEHNEFSMCVRDLHRSLQQEPVLDGFNHPGQTILERLFNCYPDAASEWLFDKIKKLSNPSSTADILRLLCRFKPHTLGWRSEVVEAALESPFVEVRDAAIQAVESWAEPTLVSLLKKHRDTAPWLTQYAAQIIRDMAG